MRQVALPYVTARDDCWQLHPWQRLDGGDGAADAALDDRIDDWDYSVPLSLLSKVSIDVSQLREQTGLSAEDPLALVGIWEASSTGIRQIGARHDLPPSGKASYELLLNLEGQRIGGQLTLERQVVLVHGSDHDDPLVARVPGSVLLAEGRIARKKVTLEGDAARFPTEVTDFSQLTIAEPDALWFLELDLSDLEQSPLSVMRLYVNGAHPSIRKALSIGDPTGDLVRSVLQWDVGRKLIDSALSVDEFVENWDSFAEGSVGETLQQLITSFWPGEDAASLRARREHNYSRFEYQLQARLGLLGGIA